MSNKYKKVDSVKIYDQQADKYSNLRKKKKSYDHNWRRELLKEATGNILELSVGAGANFRFYKKDVTVTAADISSAMIEKAKEAAKEEGFNPQFIRSPVEELHFETGQFDTIVSTLSLCAYDHPVEVIKKLLQWCKPTGKILLMEHGLATPKLLQWLQNCFDNIQYRKIGCHANRNITQIVRDAGMKIESVERKLFGMIYIVKGSPC